MIDLTGYTNREFYYKINILNIKPRRVVKGIAYYSDTDFKRISVAFEIQKKINIVMATIDMIKGAVSAFSNAQTLGPIAGPIVGSLIAASVVASGIANIKKISATKFEGGGTTSPTAPSTTGSGEAASATAGPAQPSFSLFGQPNQANTMTGAKTC